MTLDDLAEAYRDALQGAGQNAGDGHRAGILAVVTALRDEIVDKTTHYAWTGNEIFNAFEEILAPREGGKAAGGPTSDDGRHDANHAASTPAADPAVMKCKCGNDGESDHTCPYLSDVHNDDETLCNCCSDCSYQCAMDV